MCAWKHCFPISTLVSLRPPPPKCSPHSQQRTFRKRHNFSTWEADSTSDERPSWRECSGQNIRTLTFWWHALQPPDWSKQQVMPQESFIQRKTGKTWPDKLAFHRRSSRQVLVPLAGRYNGKAKRMWTENAFGTHNKWNHPSWQDAMKKEQEHNLKRCT